MNSIAQSPQTVKWPEKKLQAIKVGKKMIAAGFKKRGLNIVECSSVVLWKTCPECGRSHISSAALCRDKLCPICSWRLSLKRFAEMCCTVQAIKETEEFAAGFLTLTVKNCKPEMLRETLQEMSKAWNRMLQTKAFSPVIGWARSVEITFNQKSGEFHPHFHCVVLFKEKEKQAELQEAFRNAWKKAMRIDYDPITDYREIKASESDIDNEKYTAAILETFKYAVKSDELSAMPLNVFRTFVQAVGGLRMVSYGGIIKQARASLNYKDDDTEDVEISSAHCSCGAAWVETLMRWSMSEGQYKEVKERASKIISA
jgi:plasmid rolling circle replication initiator protein Rep